MDVVTGAFGYTGRFITQRLLQSASVVRTLTDHPHRPNPFGERVELAPLAFDDRRALVASLRGVDVLYNTYWIRFARGDVTFDRAVRNTRHLVEAAVEAGARRIVHLSIANPASSSLPYFTGKAQAEQLVVESSLRYGIVRPTVLFGGGDVLINNIAWLLRRLPVFAIAGSGAYYDAHRPHRSLELLPPDAACHTPSLHALPEQRREFHRHDHLGGLIHEYNLAA